MFIIHPKIPRKGSVYTWYIQRWKLLNGVISFTCLIYSSLSWFIFAPLVSMAFELHSQIFPTFILNLVTTLEKSLWFVLCMWSQWWRMRRYASLWLIISIGMNLSETHTLQIHESRVFISVRVYIFSFLHLQVKMLTK